MRPHRVILVDGRIVWQAGYAYDIDPATRVQTIADHAGRRRIEASPAALVQHARPPEWLPRQPR